MDDKKRLPDAELAVMQAIWAVGGEVSRGVPTDTELYRLLTTKPEEVSKP